MCIRDSDNTCGDHRLLFALLEAPCTYLTIERSDRHGARETVHFDVIMGDDDQALR